MDPSVFDVARNRTLVEYCRNAVEGWNAQLTPGYEIVEAQLYVWFGIGITPEVGKAARQGTVRYQAILTDAKGKEWQREMIGLLE